MIDDCSQGNEAVPVHCTRHGGVGEAPYWDLESYEYIRNPVLHESLPRAVLRECVSTYLGCTCNGSCTEGNTSC